MAAADSPHETDRDQPRRGSSGGTTLTASAAASEAMRQVGELITSNTVGVTSVEPLEDGWLVEVEVLEERRIPSSSDMLALYEVELDDDGELLAYRRTQRYARGRAGNGNGAS